MDFSISDLQAVGDVARRVDANPLRFGARLLGLSNSEQSAGIPAWGWVSVGLGVGLIGGLWLAKSDFLQKHLPSR